MLRLIGGVSASQTGMLPALDAARQAASPPMVFVSFTDWFVWMSASVTVAGARPPTTTGENPSRVQRAAMTTNEARNSKREVSCTGPEISGCALSQMPVSARGFAAELFGVSNTRVASELVGVDPAG